MADFRVEELDKEVSEGKSVTGFPTLDTREENNMARSMRDNRTGQPSLPALELTDNLNSKPATKPAPPSEQPLAKSGDNIGTEAMAPAGGTSGAPREQVSSKPAEKAQSDTTTAPDKPQAPIIELLPAPAQPVRRSRQLQFAPEGGSLPTMVAGPRDTSRDRITNDAQGRPLLEERRNRQEQLEARIEYRDGIRARETTFDSQGRRTSSTTFDSQGRRQEEVQYVPSTTLPRQTTQFRENGERSRQIDHGADGAPSVQRAYGENGALVTTEQMNGDGRPVSRTDHRTGTRTEIEYRQGHKADSRIEREYSAPGTPLSVSRFDMEGRRTTRETYTADGTRIASSINFAADGVTPVTESRYAENGRPSVSIRFEADGRTTAAETRFGPSGNRISETTYRNSSFGATRTSLTTFGEQSGSRVETEFHYDGHRPSRTRQFQNNRLTAETRVGLDGVEQARTSFDSSERPLVTVTPTSTTRHHHSDLPNGPSFREVTHQTTDRNNGSTEWFNQNDQLVRMRHANGAEFIVSHDAHGDRSYRADERGEQVVPRTFTDRHTAREVRVTADGQYFVRHGNEEYQFVDAGQYDQTQPGNTLGGGAINNRTDRPLLAVGNGPDHPDGRKGDAFLRLIRPGENTHGGPEIIGGRDYDGIILDPRYQPVTLPNGRILMPATVPHHVGIYKFNDLQTVRVDRFEDNGRADFSIFAARTGGHRWTDISEFTGGSDIFPQRRGQIVAERRVSGGRLQAP